MGGRKVLVVDDEIHIVHVVAIKLRNNGYEVLSAENGVDAFRLACDEKPDIVVTDYQMPTMTGLELVEKLRQNESTKDIPVIMLTARNFNVTDEQKQTIENRAFTNWQDQARNQLQIVQPYLTDQKMFNHLVEVTAKEGATITGQ